MDAGLFICLTRRNIVGNERQNPGVSSDPSVFNAEIDLDAAIEASRRRMEAARNTEQEQDDDEIEDQDTTAGTTPEDDDEDFDDTDEVKTPEDEEDDEDTTPQEPQKKSQPKKANATDDDDDEDLPQLSRKQRGRLISEIKSQLEDSEKERRRLEQQLADQAAEDKTLTEEVNRALGTDEEYDQATEDGLAGDEEAAKKARIWKANRNFYKKLVGRAKREVETGFYEAYWSQVADLPGIKPEVLQKASLAEILRHSYEAGVESVVNKKTDEVEKLKKDVVTWKGRYRTLKTQNPSVSKRSPLGGGGGETPDSSPIDWRKKYIDPVTGLFTDEADAIVEKYGLAALKDPSLRKGR